MPEYVATNLQRLMADQALTARRLAERTGLDERTIRALRRGSHRPHARTLHRLADGLGVSVDELFLDPKLLLCRHFDRATNPAIEELMRTDPELFENWSPEDFDELNSRMGSGGQLTPEGAREMVRRMNHRQELHGKLDLLLETTHAELVAQMIELMYRQSQATDRT